MCLPKFGDKMQRIEITGKLKQSIVTVGDSLTNLATYVPAERRVICISDGNVWPLYGHMVKGEHILIGRGEAYKTLATMALIYDKLLQLEADRFCFILALGGGIVCDVAGFAASTYMRGVDFGFVPTTLLAQTDASVGGKNGVNVLGYKNMIGNFNQPDFVLCTPEVLQTLPEKEVANGMAEVVKHALIADLEMFKYIEKHVHDIRRLEADCMNYLVRRSVKIKAAVVNADEREQGERRKLNFGHTLGHSLEKSLHYSHGEAVALGMLFAVALSIAYGHIAPEFYPRLQKLLRELNLPWQMPMISREQFRVMAGDKKRVGDTLHFVLLEKIGRARVHKLNLAELETMYINGAFGV